MRVVNLRIGMNRARYSIGTWDMDAQAYTPQLGTKSSFNLTLAELRIHIRALRCLGYPAHRMGNNRDGHYESDSYVLIERTDGKSEVEILQGWGRPAEEAARLAPILE